MTESADGDRLSKIRRLVVELEKAELTPFDLCSWTTLLFLTGRAGDLDLTIEITKELEDAVHRKAEDLDKARNTDFHSKIVGDHKYGV